MKAVRALIIVEDGDASVVDPGYGQGTPRPDRPGQGLPPFQGYPGQGLPGMERPTDPGYGRPGFAPGHPGNALPIAPVRPSTPIVLPPGMWPPQLPPSVDNSLPPGTPPDAPIFIPPDPSVGIENPIVIPFLPPGSALLIALPPTAQPQAGAPAGSKPAILVQPGKKPVLVYVTAAPTAQPK